MAGEQGFDKVKVFLVTNAVPVIGVLVALVGYCIYRMKKRNVKLFGR